MSPVGHQVPQGGSQLQWRLKFSLKCGPTHENTITSSPNEPGRLSIFPSCTLRRIKCMVWLEAMKVNKSKKGQQANFVINGGNMDRGTTGSLVMSLSQNTNNTHVG